MNKSRTTKAAAVWCAACLLLANAGLQAREIKQASPESVGMSSDRLARIAPAMQRYIDEPGLLQEHRENALAYAAGYTWQHKVDNIIETIRWTTGEIEQKPEFYPL